MSEKIVVGADYLARIKHGVADPDFPSYELGGLTGVFQWDGGSDNVGTFFFDNESIDFFTNPENAGYNEEYYHHLVEWDFAFGEIRLNVSEVDILGPFEKTEDDYIGDPPVYNEDGEDMSEEA